VFDIQGIDIHDNGTDYRIEVNENESATNARVDVQLKGTEAEANSDNTVSISVSQSNLNYLLVHPYSFYVCYHLPTSRLLYRMAESVFREYEHSEKHWTDQATLTVRFSEPLGEKELEKLAGLTKANTSHQRRTSGAERRASAEYSLPAKKCRSRASCSRGC
jgi:hypothetical protein